MDEPKFGFFYPASNNRDFTVTEIKDKSIQLFLDELASKAPTPGGGSAAAIMGAQSAALTSMVCNLTIGKPKYAEVENDMQALLQKSETLREELTDMIQADIDVFNRLMATYALPKETDDQKTLRSAAIQQALSEATEIPLACARACAQAVELSRIAANKGNSAAISDAGVAVMAAYSGLKSAALNVYINAGSLKDRTYADAKLSELESILNGIDVDAEQIYQLVKNKL
jgi:formiminotetrahydrofolate cyclodeaminase